MTNGAAIGYMILAVKHLGIDEFIEKLKRAMDEEMNLTTEEEAEEVYRQS